MGVNVADGDDRVPVQVGQVLGRSRQERDSDRAAGEVPDRVGVVNVRSGGATVGGQVDVVEGGLTFRR